MSRGKCYAGAAIEGTEEQYGKILERYGFRNQDSDGDADMHHGLSRRRQGLLILEICGWGEETAFLGAAVAFARSLGCRAFHIDTDDPDNPPSFEGDTGVCMTNDFPGRDFFLHTEEGPACLDWLPEYR